MTRVHPSSRRDRLERRRLLKKQLDCQPAHAVACRIGKILDWRLAGDARERQSRQQGRRATFEFTCRFPMDMCEVRWRHRCEAGHQ